MLFLIFQKGLVLFFSRSTEQVSAHLRKGSHVQYASSPPVCASGEPDPAKADDCLAWHYERISTRDKDAKRLGVPLMISEFGACLTEGPCKQEID